MTPILWLGMDPTNRGKYWDCTILVDLFEGNIWQPQGFPSFEHTNDVERAQPGMVIIIPGAEYAERAHHVNDLIAKCKPCIVFIVKDEGCRFPWRQLNLTDVRLWVQNPDPTKHDGTVRGFPVGWTPATQHARKDWDGVKSLDWFFSGQVTHSRRKQCIRQLKTLEGGRYNATPGFLKGFPVEEYLARLASCRVAPCPGGVITPDSFRCWEALELGCVPIADTIGGRGGGQGYWPHLLGEQPPFPVIDDWMEAPRLMAQCLDAWPYRANRVGSWWKGWKRRMAYKFNNDLREIGAEQGQRPGDRLTVLMPTSYIQTHPSTDIILETLLSIRRRPELDGCDIIVMADGLREQHEEHRADYEEYLRRLLELGTQTANTWVMVFDKPEHQSGMTMEALAHVHTPAILFVEHDAPLTGDIPFENLIDAVQGDADLVRLHHETQVLDCHMHLMPDGRNTKDVAGVPMVRTIQWSQRPHVASTGWYRQLLNDHFTQTRTNMFIEDRMHGVVETAWRRNGDAGWHQYRLWMFHPEGSILRSRHLDGRKTEG